MALPTTVVWEIRPTVGADTNGGGFVAGASGTDYSQQNAVQYNATDLAVDPSVNTKVTSASHSFVAADVGNLINISAGASWTLGFYQIVSVSGGAATLDRSPAATSTTGGTYAVGGALATISKAYAAAALSNTIYVKATGNYTVTATMTLTGQNLTNFSFIGYTTTRGDNGQATWTTATNSTALMTGGGSTPTGFLFQNFHFTNTAGTTSEVLNGGLSSQAYNFRFVNCLFDGVKSSITGYNSGVNFNVANVTFESCEMKNCTNHGIDCSPSINVIACIIHGSTNDGIHVRGIQSATSSTAPIYLDRSVVYNNSGKGINFAEAMPIGGQAIVYLLCSNSAVLNSTSDGIFVTAQTGNPIFPTLVIINTIIDSNGGYGINNAAATMGSMVIYNCAFRSNTSGDVHGTGVAKDANSITLTGDPFNNRSGLDFTLNSTSGAGLACQKAGFPSVLG